MTSEQRQAVYPLSIWNRSNVILAQRPTLADSNVPSDLAIVAQDCLRQSPYRALRNVVCEHQHDTLILHGRLSSYYLKQVAQETVGRVAEMVHVINAIEVA